jgi:XapX domain-containing protein
MKVVLGLSVGFLLGFACRFFDIPVPSPPKLLGAFLVVAVTVGYMTADHLLSKPAPPQPVSPRVDLPKR